MKKPKFQNNAAQRTLREKKPKFQNNEAHRTLREKKEPIFWMNQQVSLNEYPNKRLVHEERKNN